MTEGETARKPWGFFEVLANEPDHRVKRFTINPRSRLSLQRHQKRQEHWFVLRGEAVATLGDRKVTLVPGSSVDVPLRTIHRIENLKEEAFVFIEVQRGEYFEDDDIERLADDYGRV
jgi:mannose-6-phosphate isomerase-like protein (cupin superfamily)